MLSVPVKTFVHPQSAYRLEYPAHWDQVIEKEGTSCGFGPHERDDVGLWISIMPFSLDTEKLEAELPKMFAQALEKAEALQPRRDPTLKQHGMIADMAKEGEGGHYWIVAGGDIVLFASTQVPAAERDTWNPLFAKVMASLQITRDQELLMRRLANDVLAKLRAKHPEQDFAFDEDRIRGKEQVVFLSNLFRAVRASPNRRETLIDEFIAAIARPDMAQFGYETWEEAKPATIPVLKPKAYIANEGPTQHMLTQEWLADVLICYALRRKKASTYRFVTGWDVNRWGITPEVLHEAAIANLVALSWPRELVGARAKDGGRIMVVQTDDGMSSSRLLHPNLHQMFSEALGSTFWAGIPCRDTLVLYSDRRALKQRTGRRLRKDHDASAYPITPHPFLVTRDGIAPSVGDKEC